MAFPLIHGASRWPTPLPSLVRFLDQSTAECFSLCRIQLKDQASRWVTGFTVSLHLKPKKARTDQNSRPTNTKRIVGGSHSWDKAATELFGSGVLALHRHRDDQRFGVAVGQVKTFLANIYPHLGSVFRRPDADFFRVHFGVPNGGAERSMEAAV